MAIISDKLNKILSAVFGKDVRQALHDGLDAINKETESTTVRQDYLDRKYDEQIKNMTVQDPSSAEIVDMRVAANGKTFEKAGDRLNYFDEQLDNKANEGFVIQQLNLKSNTSYVDEEVAKIVASIEKIEVDKSSKVEVASLQSQINSLVVNGNGTQNAEVVQARNSLFGTNTVLNDRLNNNENAMQKYFNRKFLWKFVIGGISSLNLNVDTSQTWRISTPNILIADENITVDTNFILYQIGIILYNADGTLKEDKGWLSAKYVIPVGTYFRISLQKKNVYAPITDVYNNEIFKSLMVESDLTLDKMKSDIDDLKLNVNTEIPLNSIGVSKLFDLELDSAPQGHMIINNELWVMYSSADDNTSWMGQINRYSLETLQKTTVSFHDLGHCPSVNYNKEKDIIILTNGSGNTSIKPKLQFFKNGKNKTDMYMSNEDYLEIPFFTDSKEIGGSGCVACFGENFNIVYMLTGNAPKKLHKVLLGVGGNDLSDSTGTDITKWGTFNSVNDGELNGTAQILKSYDISFISDVFQDVTYKDGFIQLLVGYRYAKIYKIKLYSNEAKINEAINIVDYDNFGNAIISEPEGICFDGNRCIVSLYKSNDKKVVELI